MPAYNVRGIRESALRAQASDRVNDAAKPYLRRLLLLKRMYKSRFNAERLERIDRMIESSNATCYSKLANCQIAIKKGDTKEVKRKRGWTESDWKKRMDYINTIAGPRRDFRAPPPSRGIRKPLNELMQTINQISLMPEFKQYRRLSKESFYRDPIKVSPGALKYVISDRVKKLAEPKPLPQADY